MPRWGRKPKVAFRKMLIRAAMAAAVGVAALNIDWALLKDSIPIRYVRVEGEINHLDASELDRAVLPLTKAGYFSVDVRGIESVVRLFPWIDGADVARVWPDTVLLKVVEHKPVARWGEDGLLNHRGERFSPGNVAAYSYLPALYGPPGQEKLVLAMLHLLNEKWRGRRVRIEALRLSKRQAWTARLTSGMEIEFGKQDPSVATDRLLVLLPQLGEERIAAIQKVDLRYPNGFSVVWRPAPSLPAEPSSTGT
jgi:cell division protein FtsQ